MSVPTPLTEEPLYYRIPIEEGVFEAYIPNGSLMTPDSRDTIVSMFGAIKRLLDKRVAEHNRRMGEIPKPVAPSDGAG